MRALEFIAGHVIYNPAYTYKLQLKTTLVLLSNLYAIHKYIATSKYVSYCKA